MKVSVLKFFLIITLAISPAMQVLAQQPGNDVPPAQGQTVGTADSTTPPHLAWGYKMLLGLLAGMAIGFILRPRRVRVDEDTGRDRAA